MTSRVDRYIKLNQPPLLDFSRLKSGDNCDNVKIVIHNTQHKFATDAEYSGANIKKHPIFGSQVFINGKEFSKSSYGLPFIRFAQGTNPKITYENKTPFTFNIHYHGLNTVGSVDGTSMEVVFGHSTLLGSEVTFQFPKITNNQSLLWFHSHNMFVSMELIYAGIIGLLQITDKKTEWLTNHFEYGNNQILLAALDMDLTNRGTQTFANLVADENRSCFAVINGQSCVNWYSDPNQTQVPFVNMLYHKTNRNLVKIDILNASLNWRVFHLGVCDEDNHIKSFYLVQTDSGLMNPTELKMVFVPVASRLAIIVDLKQFKNHTAYLFFYNYDLTEVLGSMPTFPNQPNNSTITATVPDLSKSTNPTPYPTPIPDPNQQNQQDNFTNLKYPTVPLIAQTEQILENGSIKVPDGRKQRIKPFLKIILNKRHHTLSLNNVITDIRKTIFGSGVGNEDHEQHTSQLTKTCPNACGFEYDPKYNYLSFLNPNYYYNLPSFSDSLPTRNILLFFETGINAIAGGNPNGTTEYINSANRIMADLWNSAELDLASALQQYSLAPNNYKPSVLPTSKFRIYKTNDRYSNTAMISNDTLTIQFFSSAIAYGDLSTAPLSTVTVIFPPTPQPTSLNLQEWINLVNLTFSQTTVTIGSSQVNLSSLIQCDWSFFPYALDFLYQKTVYVKSAVIKTRNGSQYYIRFLGRWPMLQFFGKPLTGSTLDPSTGGLIAQLRNKQKTQLIAYHNKLVKDMPSGLTAFQEKQCRQITQSNQSSHPPVQSNRSLYTRCDEEARYGILDAEIQQIFPFYATSDPNTQLPIACMRRDAELIINPQSTYIGLYDGYLNDNLKSFSVKLKSSEIWIYTNGDCADAHSLHFHLTSGYASPLSNYNSPGLLSCKRTFAPLIYPRDIYQVGPQEVVAFFLTWPHYSSYDQTSSPKINGIGGVIHCHFLQHNDANSMIIQYFVEGQCEP